MISSIKNLFWNQILNNIANYSDPCHLSPFFMMVNSHSFLYPCSAHCFLSALLSVNFLNPLKLSFLTLKIMMISHLLYVQSFIMAHKAHCNLAFPNLTWILFPLYSLYPGHTTSHAFSRLSPFYICASAHVIFPAWNVLHFLFYLETSYEFQNIPRKPFRFFFIAFCYFCYGTLFILF